MDCPCSHRLLALPDVRRFFLLLFQTMAATMTFVGGEQAAAAVLNVPQDYPNIAQAAVAAVSGDSILVWYGVFENEVIEIRQGVTLRGMAKDISDTYLRSCFLSLLESPAVAGIDDTTRVEHLYITALLYEESIHVLTPRSSVSRCRLFTNGGPYWPVIRVWRGGAIVGNLFSGGSNDGEAIEAREGRIVIAWNMFDGGLGRAFSLYNDTALEPLTAIVYNNTMDQCNYDLNYISLRSDSACKLVNNIFWYTPLSCSGGTIDIRYNDYFPGLFSDCLPIGPGNISANPLLCVPETAPFSLWVEADSPCVGAGEHGVTMGAGGVCGITGIDEAPSAPAVRLSVAPNPVFGDAEFRFDDRGGAPSLQIFDAQGRLVDLLIPQMGIVRWSPRDESRGIYFARLTTNGRSETVKFILMR